VTPSPARKHQAIVWNLTVMIGTYLQHHPIGRALTAPFHVIFSEFDVVEPDLLYVAAARTDEVLTSQHVRGAPDLVVEISSPATRKRDETIKRRLYERAGVSEYWVIDPELDLIRIYRRSGDTFAQPIELSIERADTLTTALMPGLVLPLSRIFQD
jgi:Uma2 family endonuclease